MSPFSLLITLLCLSCFVEASYSSFLLLVITSHSYLLVTATVCVFSCGLLNLLVFSLFALTSTFFSTHSLLLFYISFEFSLLPVLLIILFFGYQPEKLNASIYLLLYTTICSLPLLYFVSVSGLSLFNTFCIEPGFVIWLLSLSFLVKSPLWLLHSWLPKAHVEAPIAGSILLAGVILKIGGYGMLVFRPVMTLFSSVYIYLTLYGGVCCGILCSRSWDAKALVAYSSVVHIGRVTLGALSGTELGFWCASSMLVAHTLVSPLLFLLAFELYTSNSSRCFVHGWASSFSRPFLLVFCVCSGLNFGLPPSLGFWSEVSLYLFIGSLNTTFLLPLLLRSFFAFLYSIIFYLGSVGSVPSCSRLSSPSLFGFLPGLTYSLLLSFSLSFM